MLDEKFWSKVVPGVGDCWHWDGSHLDGYGIYQRKTDGRWRTVSAHRVAYEQLVTEVPAGMEIDHLCRNRGCVNPYHLDPVTHAVNMARSPIVGRANAEKTHCGRGHEFTPENTRVAPQSMGRAGTVRTCRACDRLLARKYRAARRDHLMNGGTL